MLLLGACLLVLRPFFSAVLWAAVLCFTSWPIYQRLLRLLGNRRTLAALAMSLGMILIVLLPFVIIGATLADNVKALTAAARHWIGPRPARAARVAGEGAGHRPPGNRVLAKPGVRHGETLDGSAALHREGSGRGC